MLAPIIMGYIGQQKQPAIQDQEASSGNPITDLLEVYTEGGENQQQSQGGLGSLLGGLFGWKDLNMPEEGFCSEGIHPRKP
ncbi:hypothetical protein FQR65_LT19586 [Abscondita terminalis]|nr:hypothetical protein FQR65_LT19586 [Abscondita terminalis]